mgnify:CR=1 FL=1
MALTDQQYYSSASNYGDSQFVSLKDVINNFYLFYVGDEKLINNVNRFDVIFHAKRAVQELNYDALKNVKALELELPNTLQLALPKDFVRLIRLSWVDERGRLHPLMVDNNTTIAKSYLQDNNYNILFDDEGDALEGTSFIDTKLSEIQNPSQDASSSLSDEFFGGRFGLDTAVSNVNGRYNLDKTSGIIRFSSEVKGKYVVIEYLTDGLEYLAEDEIKINKLAEDYMYKQIAYEVIKHKFNVQEYVVRRIKNEAFASMKNMKIRLMEIHPFDLIQTLQGRNKWIK